MSLDAGADGVITVDGRISEDAASSLAADGFVRLLRDVVADRPGLDAEDPAQAADTPLDAAGAARPLTTPILRPNRDRRREGVVGRDVQVVVSAESSEEGGGALVDRVGRMVNVGDDAWSGWPVSEVDLVALIAVGPDDRAPIAWRRPAPRRRPHQLGRPVRACVNNRSDLEVDRSRASVPSSAARARWIL